MRSAALARLHLPVAQQQLLIGPIGPHTADGFRDPTPPRNLRRSLEAIRYLKGATLGTNGIEVVSLRFGNFYGSGTGSAANRDILAAYASMGCRSWAMALAFGRSPTRMMPH